MAFKRYFKGKTKSRSGFEERIKRDLDSRKVKYGYETIRLKYTKLCCKACGEIVNEGRYTPDFIIERNSGICLVVEAKGRFTSPDRTKLRSVKRDNPNHDIRLLFQRNDPIRRGSKTRYGDWATRHGFIWAEGESIPEGWLR